jgi:hypothetical protein
VESDFREAWRYRDWVVDSFNRDLPYTDFVRMQIAGDLQPSPLTAGFSKDGLVATGLLAIADFVPGDVDKNQMIADYVNDQVDVVSRAFLGLSVACARCHDHKFDPISTEDYYAMSGIFFSSRIIPGPVAGNTPLVRVPLLSPMEIAQQKEEVAADARRRSELERSLAPRGAFGLLESEHSTRLASEQRKELEAQRAELEALRNKRPVSVPMAVVIQDGGPKGTRHEGFADAHVFIRGDSKRLGKMVPRGFPKILTGKEEVKITDGSGRLQLANWLTRPENPLTARVMVNRIWQHHFGEGLVRTPNDFGERGERPTHPELLNFLAAKFVESGWSVKTMHRLIMLSATYQQSSSVSAATLARDPENRLFGRMNRQRLEAEAIRDSLLAVSGKLDPARGGPPFTELAVPRRTLYLMSARTGANTSDFGRLFDRADPSLIVAQRGQSVVAPQALFFLNDPFVSGTAKALATRIVREAPANAEARIKHLYALVLGRPPTQAEVELGVKLLGGGPDALERYCLLVLCTNEFLYID